MPILVMEGGLFFLVHHETYGGAVVYLPQFMPILVMEGGLLFLTHHETYGGAVVYLPQFMPILVMLQEVCSV